MPGGGGWKRVRVQAGLGIEAICTSFATVFCAMCEVCHSVREMLALCLSVMHSPCNPQTARCAKGGGPLLLKGCRVRGVTGV